MESDPNAIKFQDRAVCEVKNRMLSVWFLKRKKQQNSEEAKVNRAILTIFFEYLSPENVEKVSRYQSRLDAALFECGACEVCRIEREGCQCILASSYDDGCFQCLPDKNLRPICLSIAATWRCGECQSCRIEAMGCGCDGALDDGCFDCTPDKHPRPPCPGV